MGAPGFWDDQDHAAQISTEHSRVQRKLDRYEQLTRDYEDARELYSMDGGMEAEIVDSITPLKQDLDRLEEEALFSGEYDAGDAVVTLQSTSAAQTRRTSPRCSCACTNAGHSSAASRAR